MHRVLLILILASPAAWSWGRTGHELIGEIAARHLSPAAIEAVAGLLEPGETLASVGPWADEIRAQRRETGPWHFINLPVHQARGDWRPFCPPSGCVVSIIPEMAARLRNPALPRAERAEALKFLVHFVGDLHQPLHVGDRGDRGGNEVPVVFLDRPSNLHSVWDTPLILYLLDQHPQARQRLTQRITWWTRRMMERGTFEDWAWESHAISRDVAYRHLPDGDPALLGEAYARVAAPAVQLQLQRAGVRLARVLNEAFAQ